MATLQAHAHAVGGPAVAVTLEPHPRALLQPDLVVPPLTTLADRVDWLHQMGADHVVILHTTAELLGLSASGFFTHVIQENLAPRVIVEGHNFGFGHGREGNVTTLEQMCAPAGIQLVVVGPVVIDGVEVSSSRIRAALLDGDIATATHLLGRPYRLHGTVIVGQQRGRSLGFPTANLGQIENLLPADGVYAVRALVDGKAWAGAASLGPNPSFGENARKVETHLLDFQGDLYGQPLVLDFIQRLRDVRTFASLAELLVQIRQDVEAAGQAVQAFCPPLPRGESDCVSCQGPKE
jgi:riboflavin kinase/FMN adenylyltransferase